MTNADFIAAHRARRASLNPPFNPALTMKKSNRLKTEPLTREAFLGLVAEITSLEAQVRALAGKRDVAIADVTEKFQTEIDRLKGEVKGKLAQVEDYAEENRATLLPKDAKSFAAGTARLGWRTGNPTVKFLSRQTEESVVTLLHGHRLDAYVRTVEEVNKELIKCDCADGVHLIAPVLDPAGNAVFKDGVPVTRTVPLVTVGLKITQSETFFMEPASADATTVSGGEAAA